MVCTLWIDNFYDLFSKFELVFDLSCWNESALEKFNALHTTKKNYYTKKIRSGGLQNQSLELKELILE